MKIHPDLERSVSELTQAIGLLVRRVRAATASQELSWSESAVLGRLAMKARVVLCGVISSYLSGEHPGPANYVNLLSKTATMQGFNALDEWGRFGEAFAALRQWEHEGKIRHRQTIFEGVESCVDALNGLFTGANIGKMLVKLNEPTTA